MDKNLTKADMEQIAAGIQLDDGEIHADAISYTDDFKKDDVGIEIHSGKTVSYAVSLNRWDIRL